MVGRKDRSRAVVGALLLAALLGAAPASAQDAGGGPSGPDSAPGEESSRLDGAQLYWAQVVGQLGAEALVGSLTLCPFVSWIALAAAPIAGVLAADWVGREMGLRAGSQVAAFAGNYLVGCTGVTAVAGGAFFTYLVLAIGLPITLVSSPTGIAIVAVLAAGGVVAVLAGAAALLARPFLTPLLWSAFTADEGSP
ncbi:MAG: hypothetical protein JXR83_12380 [Deltaproteobacteria bacterium]|nr:hypothetical protein [Deltaproteobacteria bacterium]